MEELEILGTVRERNCASPHGGRLSTLPDGGSVVRSWGITAAGDGGVRPQPAVFCQTIRVSLIVPRRNVSPCYCP